MLSLASSEGRNTGDRVSLGKTARNRYHFHHHTELPGAMVMAF